jgi:hypothetical protein
MVASYLSHLNRVMSNHSKLQKQLFFTSAVTAVDFEMSLLKANEKAFGDEIAEINICINLLPDLSGGKLATIIVTPRHDGCLTLALL